MKVFAVALLILRAVCSESNPDLRSNYLDSNKELSLNYVQPKLIPLPVVLMIIPQVSYTDRIYSTRYVQPKEYSVKQQLPSKINSQFQIGQFTETQIKQVEDNKSVHVKNEKPLEAQASNTDRFDINTASSELTQRWMKRCSDLAKTCIITECRDFDVKCSHQCFLKETACRNSPNLLSHLPVPQTPAPQVTQKIEDTSLKLLLQNQLNG